MKPLPEQTIVEMYELIQELPRTHQIIAAAQTQAVHHESSSAILSRWDAARREVTEALVDLRNPHASNDAQAYASALYDAANGCTHVVEILKETQVSACIRALVPHGEPGDIRVQALYGQLTKTSQLAQTICTTIQSHTREHVLADLMSGWESSQDADSRPHDAPQHSR